MPMREYQIIFLVLCSVLANWLTSRLSIGSIDYHDLQGSLPRSKLTNAANPNDLGTVSANSVVEKQNVEKGVGTQQALSSNSHRDVIVTTNDLVLDILSIGSQTRQDYLRAQRETFGRHHSVRHFVGVTEADDTESCDMLERDDVERIARRCKVRWLPHWPTPGAPQSVIHEQRSGYADWDMFLSGKANPAGWLCAQRRANAGFFAALKTYPNTSMFPDYLIIMDDDTYMDLTAVTDYLNILYNPHERLAMAGCLIRFTFFKSYSTVPYGGWGTILSRASLEAIVKPIYCNNSDSSSQSDEMDDFTQHACLRLQQNLFNEQVYFQEGMNLAELMNAYVVTDQYANSQTWTRDHNFCAHSDWIWGFFFTYYNVGSHTGDPFFQQVDAARMASYRASENQVFPTRGDVFGQCVYEREKCDPDVSHICHYINPEQMRSLSAVHQQRNFDHFSLDATGGLVQQHRPPYGWSAVWSKTPRSRNTSMARSTASIRQEDPDRAIPVFVHPPNRNEHELKHFVLNGIEQSAKLILTQNAAEANVWVIDAQQSNLQDSKACEEFADLVSKSRSEKQQLSNLADWKLIVLHWEEDDGMVQFSSHCSHAWRAIDSMRIGRFKRSMVNGRRWNETTQFVETGHVVNYGNWRDHSGAPVQRLNYGVRSDVVEGIQQILAKEGEETSMPEQQLRRSTDISHFWPLRGQSDNLIDRGSTSSLRAAISEMIRAEFQNSTIVVNLTGDAKDAGRNVAQPAYLRQLLDSKIVVVAQRDTYEDHYRLMEALASGAMVMTDPMHTLPEGLIDGISVVVYNSLEELVSKARYYLLAAEQERLDIAMVGYRVAMGQHRSWQMMERIVGV